MADYHVDPATGVDTNTGASWAQAWKTPNGLRVNSVVMVAGDRLKFAKSVMTTGNTGDTVQFPTFTGQGITFFGSAAWTYISRRSTTATNFPSPRYFNGTWQTTLTWQFFTANFYPFEGRSTTGLFNPPSRRLAYQFASNLNFNGLRTVWMWFRVSVPYTGAGDIDVPPGTFSILLCSDGAGLTPLLTIPVDVWIKNTGEWACVRYEHPADFTTLGAVNSVAVHRTAQTLNRDNTGFGLTWSPLLFGRTAIQDHSLDYVFKVPDVRPSPAIQPDAVLVNPFCLAEIMYPVHGMTGSNIGYTIPTQYSASNTLTLADRYTAFPVPPSGQYGLGYVGTANWPFAAPTSTGAFDLNGSAGGTLAQPVTLEGGWNTATDVVDGATVYTGRTPQEYGHTAALFDLQNAEHVVIKNIGAIYGFGRLIDRARTITLDRCHLPYSHRGGVNTLPPLGTPSTAINCTMKNMMVPNYTFEYIGVIGNLTLQNFFANTFEDRSPLQYVEVENLVMDAAYVGRRNNTDVYTWHFSVRGDAELANTTIIYPPRIVNRSNFGRTMTIRNLWTWSQYVSQGYRLVPTLPDSRWDTIVYRNNGSYNGDWAPGSTTLPASCDRRIEFRDNTNSILVNDTLLGSQFENTEAAQLVGSVKTLTAGFYSFSLAPNNSSTGTTPGLRAYSYAYRFQLGGSNFSDRWAPLASTEPSIPQDVDFVFVGSNAAAILPRSPAIFFRSAQDYFLLVSYSSGYPGSAVATAYVEGGKNYKFKLGCQYRNLSIQNNASGAPPWYNVFSDNFSCTEPVEHFKIVIRGPGVVAGVDLVIPYLDGPYNEFSNTARNDWRDLEFPFSTIAEGEVTIYLYATLSNNSIAVIIDKAEVELA